MAKPLGKIQTICESLFEEFQRLIPLLRSGNGRRPSEKEIQAASAAGLSRFYAAAKAERQKYRLGIVGRARVAFGLQQRLLDAGYPPHLVKQVLFAMLSSAFVGDGK
jgi:hypothetical protein